MVTSCLICKYRNSVGTFSCQYVEDGKVKICCFSSFASAVSFAFLNWNLTEETHFLNRLFLKRKED